MYEIECVCNSQDGLGESPIWVEKEKSLYWSDHLGPNMKRLNTATQELKVWKMPEQVGSFAFREKGGLIAGTNSGFHTIDLESGEFKKVIDPEPDMLTNRLNDGKIDRSGRYWCGSMDAQLEEKTGHIYRLNPDNSCQKMASDFNFIVSNGIAFSPDNKRMYFGDTRGGMIYTFDFDMESGVISNQKEFFSTKNMEGMVDGATVDRDGYYWFALVRAGCKILRVDPKGRLDLVVDMPVPSCTCVTFGGDNYETLYVTTARAFLSEDTLEKYPQSGNIFAVHGLGVRGFPEPLFAG
jgi:sugar lactone lactonase YvrE